MPEGSRQSFSFYAETDTSNLSCTPIITGVRANIHLGGGADQVLPEWIRWGGGSSRNCPGTIFCGGGGVVAEIFSGIHILWGGRIVQLTAVSEPQFVFFSVNCSNRP